MMMRVKISEAYDSDDSYHVPDFFVPTMDKFLKENFVHDKDYRTWSTCTHYCYAAAKIEYLITSMEFFNVESMNLFLTMYGDLYEKYELTKW